ncbi:MAG: hypothetical protein C0474_00190 [Sphingobium sp.]|nr:hypothetical protein [Sphingobium sp.]
MITPCHVVITMAGMGSRFRAIGYRVPKYRALARGRPLFDWAIGSLASFIAVGAHFTFVLRREDDGADFVRQRAASLGIAGVTVIEIDALTDGQATSALRATDTADFAGVPLVIYNIDTYVDPASLPVAAVRGDGWIPCFAAAGDAWSFVALGPHGRAQEVREKQRISPHATIGLYHFGSAALFRELYAETYLRGGKPEAGERYVAPMYNALIARGGAVYVHDVPVTAVVPLGTPAEVLAFDPAAGPNQVV